MRATLEFNLPEEREDHNLAIHGLDFALVCWDMDVKLRNWLKYGHKFKTADEALEAARDYLCEAMETHNVNFDMIS